jgi:hypothetical protein
MPMNPEQIEAMKALIAVARKRPLNFGLCIGKQPEGTILEMHRTKNPDALGLLAKKSGETGRIAIGTLEVKGKIVTLSCAEDPPAGLAKRTKQFFKFVDMKMNVRVADAEGNVLDEDVDDDGGPDEAGAAADDEAQEAETQDVDAVDANQLKWESSRGAFAGAVAKAAERGIGPVDKISAVWNFAVGKADAGDFSAALGALRPLSDLLKAAAQDAGTVAPTSASDPTPVDPDAARWASAKEMLAPMVAAAIESGGAAADKINAAWNLALTRAAAGDIQTALKASQTLATALRQMSGAAPVPLDRLEKLRGEWQAVRDTAARDVDRLKTAITDFYDGFPGVEQDLMAAQKRLDTIFATLGPELDQQLAQVIAEPDATRRKPLIDTARNTVRGHAAYVMGDPVFKEIDGNEILPSIVVADPIRRKLAEVSALISTL